MKIAYIVYEHTGTFGIPDEENQSLLQFLRQKGLSVQLELWTNAHVAWQEYDLILLKAPWDYIDKIDRFHHWLETLEKLKVRLLNPIKLVRWNSDKHYLKDIADVGLSVAPTLFVEPGEQLQLHRYFEEFNSEKLVVKPCVSGASKNTFCVTRDNTKEIETMINELLQREAFIVQPFIPEIVQDGEWSIIFFNGVYSHSLIKRAKTGDFRVQNQFGGSVHPVEPDRSVIDSAAQYVLQFAQHCLYARVDGVVVQGKFMLMELEIIEPVLFLYTASHAYENYYKALCELM
ncbi:MAG: ATP-grasp domain-containing protein [Bacteroidota bacterium]